MDVVSVAGARSLKVCSDGAGSSPRPTKWKLEPRTVALSASVEHVLISAGLKASEQLKRTWPKFSAATYNRFANVIPSLFGVLALAANFTTYGTVLLSAIVVLPSAFRLFVATQSRPISKAARRRPTIPGMPDKELPVYSIIVPLRDEARMVDQLLSAIEALDYPTGKLDVIIAVEADGVSGQKTTTVNCPAGDFALSGGFSAQGSVTESYRSNASADPTGNTAWTVTQSSGNTDSLKVYVYCVAGS